MKEKKDNQDVDDVFSPKGAVSGGRRKGFFHRLFTIYTNDLAVRCSNAALVAATTAATHLLSAFALRHAVSEQQARPDESQVCYIRQWPPLLLTLLCRCHRASRDFDVEKN